ncbi:MAG: hypothetical protein ACI9OJ_004982, partial [Myxococcota bacterium]
YYDTGKFIQTWEISAGAPCSAIRRPLPGISYQDVGRNLPASFAGLATAQKMEMVVSTVGGSRKANGMLTTVCIPSRNRGVYVRWFDVRDGPASSRCPFCHPEGFYSAVGRAGSRGPVVELRPLKSKAFTLESGVPAAIDLGAVQIKHPNDGRLWGAGASLPPHLGVASEAAPLVAQELPALSEVEIALEPVGNPDCGSALKRLKKRVAGTRFAPVGGPSGLKGPFHGRAVTSAGAGAFGLSFCLALTNGPVLVHVWDTAPLAAASQFVPILNSAATSLTEWDVNRHVLMAASNASGSKASGGKHKPLMAVVDLDTPAGRRMQKRRKKAAAPLTNVRDSERSAVGCIRAILYCYSSLGACRNLSCGDGSWQALVRVAETVSSAKYESARGVRSVGARSVVNSRPSWAYSAACRPKSSLPGSTRWSWHPLGS